ncbi:MAG: UDP-N-acetylglucosamine 2-epimerase (non-hydrolyzing) [Alphaproteobacteria bacterium]
MPRPTSAFDMSHTVHLIAAARPNFMKVAPLLHALAAEPWCRPQLIHTGQHYDVNMSETFFRDLRLPSPDHHLGVGSGTHAEQTGAVMVAYERICMQTPPDLTVVVGDVNSTLACTLAAKKLVLPVAHLEAGLRSRDWSMPEEINRIVTDSISDILWTPSPDADQNLHAEGVAAARVTRVGNIMLDSYELLRPAIEQADARSALGLAPRGYGVVTLHRPVNVDDRARLAALVETMVSISTSLPLVFPLHPRTRKNLETFGLAGRLAGDPRLIVTEPLSYVRFMALVREARLVITDSGGVQEETTYLGIPCLTLRETTERPITVTEGTNRLVKLGSLAREVGRALVGDWPSGRKPDLWDGQTAGRVVADIARRLGIGARVATASRME